MGDSYSNVGILITAHATGDVVSGANVARPSASKGWERRVWSVAESLAELVSCVAEVWANSQQ